MDILDRTIIPALINPKKKKMLGLRWSDIQLRTLPHDFPSSAVINDSAWTHRLAALLGGKSNQPEETDESRPRGMDPFVPAAAL